MSGKATVQTKNSADFRLNALSLTGHTASLIFLREGSGWRHLASNSLKLLKIISSPFHTPADSSTWLLSAPEIVNYEPLGLEADMW